MHPMFFIESGKISSLYIPMILDESSRYLFRVGYISERTLKIGFVFVHDRLQCVFILYTTLMCLFAKALRQTVNII